MILLSEKLVKSNQINNRISGKKNLKVEYNYLDSSVPLRRSENGVID